jgi:hypothetical protein
MALLNGDEECWTRKDTVVPGECVYSALAVVVDVAVVKVFVTIVGDVGSCASN